MIVVREIDNSLTTELDYAILYLILISINANALQSKPVAIMKKIATAPVLE